MVQFNTVLAHLKNYWYQLKNFYLLIIHHDKESFNRINNCLYDSLEKIRKEDFDFILQLIKTKRTCTTDIYCLECLNNLENEIKKILQKTENQNNIDRSQL